MKGVVDWRKLCDKLTVKYTRKRTLVRNNFDTFAALVAEGSSKLGRLYPG